MLDSRAALNFIFSYHLNWIFFVSLSFGVRCWCQFTSESRRVNIVSVALVFALRENFRVFDTVAILFCDLNVGTMAMFRLITVFVIFCEVNSIARNETKRYSSSRTVDPSISWFLKSTPFVDLSKVSGINVECRKDFQTFLTAMDNLELWALKSENLKVESEFDRENFNYSARRDG